jgi:3-hydroxy-D-aspartate aldolase
VTVGILVEFDIGMGRAGVRSVEDVPRLAATAARSPGVEFRGLQAYEGHLVFAQPGGEKESALAEAFSKLARASAAVEAAGLECGVVSGGGTGTYRYSGANGVMSEIQAGSYATMDARYARLVPEFENALFCLITIVSSRAGGRAIGDAGLKSLTSEFGMPEVRWPDGLTVAKLAEEHTIFEAADGPRLEPGSKVLAVPSHGCTTINLHDNMYGVRAGVVECVLPVSARGRVT